MSVSKHVAVWFEIPAKDLDRAAKFYGQVLGVVLETTAFGDDRMAFFPASGAGGDADVVHGALVQGPGYEPGDKGPLLYLNGGADLATPLARVAAAGGKVVLEKTAIGKHGWMGIFLDTEGNRVAFHSRA
jgi:predicted enzyme related to lactoylglutathione lyase